MTVGCVKLLGERAAEVSDILMNSPFMEVLREVAVGWVLVGGT